MTMILTGPRDIASAGPQHIALADERFCRTERAPGISPKRLLPLVDLAFEHYLGARIEESAKQGEAGERPAAELRHWQELHAATPLSAVLRKYLPGANFDDERPLTPRQLAAYLYACGRIGDRIVEIERADRITQRQAALTGIGASPLSNALRIAFNDHDDEFITGASHAVIETFFTHYLLTSYFFEKDPSTQELAREALRETEEDFDSALNLFTRVVLNLPESAEHTALLHTLLRASYSPLPREAMEGFIEQAAGLCGSEQAPRLPSAAEIGALAERFFPQFAFAAGREPLVRVAKAGPPGARGAISALVPAGNFIFHPLPAEAPRLEDLGLFPQEGNIESDRSKLIAGRTNVSVFDTRGLKVFWGDLPVSTIGEMKGPFYVLSQGDSYHSVPAWAVGKRASPHDPNRAVDSVLGTGEPFAADARQLDTEYIRYHALGMIRDGVFHPNAKMISADVLGISERGKV